MDAALREGIPGMLAMGAQVTTLMWMRTTTNYQYRHGTTMLTAMRALYSDGGWRRFYRGYAAAMVQAPLSRFGDTAANAAVMTAMAPYPHIPVFIQTLAASLSAASFRTLLMPIDTVKTTLQANGTDGAAQLREKIRVGGPRVLFHGAMAASLATLVGHYPWFLTYNLCNKYLPESRTADRRTKLVRAAAVGFASSLVSDVCSNSIRVLKTVRQTSAKELGYREAFVQLMAQEGSFYNVATRGLGTKIMTNGVQGVLFSVLWKLGKEKSA